MPVISSNQTFRDGNHLQETNNLAYPKGVYIAGVGNEPGFFKLLSIATFHNLINQF